MNTLAETTLKLINEVFGLAAFEVEIREIIGNTNWEALALRTREARAALSSRSAEAGKPVVEGLGDSALVKLMYKHLPPKVADDLTIDKHPPMFPQAEYSVPTLSARNFVDALRSALSTPADSEPVAWLHPTANWSHVDYDRVRMHCGNGGPLPVPLYAAPVADSEPVSVPDDPMLDGTDSAHPAWWRGCDHGYSKGLAAAPQPNPSADVGSQQEAARIGDTVLAWMVKYDLLDAGNEYRAEDVAAVLNDFTPSDATAELKQLRDENAKFRKALTKIAERADDNLPMYTPGAMVHTADAALAAQGEKP